MSHPPVRTVVDDVTGAVTEAEVRAWCDAQSIALIEDCAHSFFGTAGNRPVGAWGDYGLFAGFVAGRVELTLYAREHGIA